MLNQTASPWHCTICLWDGLVGDFQIGASGAKPVFGSIQGCSFAMCLIPELFGNRPNLFGTVSDELWTV